MRPSPLPAQTAQTPALPGFRVSGDAKNAGFESFATSPGYHPIQADSGISDPSALVPAKEPVSPTPRATTSFERVQIAAPLEHEAEAGFAIYVPQRPSEQWVEAAALAPSPHHRSSDRQRESRVFDPSLLRRPQVAISSRPFATRHSLGRLSAGLFERRLGADALDSCLHRHSVQRRPKAGASSRLSPRQPFERVQMPPMAGPSLRNPSHRSLFERVQTAAITRQFLRRHLDLDGALFEHLRLPPAAEESPGTPVDCIPFERVQMAGAGGPFCMPSRQPSLEPRPSAPRATHARPNPTPAEEIRMPPPQ